ncbi:SpoIIE family protein phosphatase [Mycolicibacterium rhodesiae]|uniref:Protein-serine/threonine phosphatase n=1 Tax=Mycolicibacterium rhodesiae TaxID=36814 RepID=A0A1X0J5T4_MYCRH|nr:SpoIIE family protein phosphatase [Mycolicibacterium rhodesiae]MCV7348335.1 SpoIIE family protein phosphatase [Mycolicibacterium rhodesiae]ORB57341.1 histidine kinase [Mycolicibacterium rhodesiae]
MDVGSASGPDDHVGRDLAAVDWASTPLGPSADWPQSLRTAVSIVLSSRFSMWMAWGPELTFFCNDAYRRDTLGRKYPWALGRPASEVWAEIWDDVGPRVDRVLTTGEATWDEGLLLFLERSGYPEETYHTFSYSPLRDETGHVVGMLCVVSEDTDRVIGERRMATLRHLGSDPSVVRTESEMLAFAARQLDRNTLDLPFTLTYLFDDDGIAVLAGSSGIAVAHPAAPAVLRSDSGMWPVNEPAHGQSVVVDLDGPSFTDLPTGGWRKPPSHALVTPLLAQGGDPPGFLVAALNPYRPLDDEYRGFIDLVAGHIATGVSSARSYSEQQRRADELAELDRAKTTFFSNISHEFRTPITLILGPVGELRAHAGLDERAQQELDVIQRNGLRLAKLVNTLLDFSRIEANRVQARYEPVDLAQVTAELASVFRSAIDRADLQLIVDCRPLAEPVYLDRDMWEKVILNLLSNALKYTFSGSITVRVTQDGDQAVVTVADTGIGVPAAEMPRLFERFHRIESARARSTEGSGIGLALVKELVGLHGGTITAESVEDAGTTFTIRLPIGAGHLPSEALSPAGTSRSSNIAEPYVQEALRWLPDSGNGDLAAVPNPPPVVESTSRVLVADDNADMREYLVRLLRGAGYEVDEVADGQQALSRIRADRPDLVVSDVMMPRLDGLALVAALRNDPHTVAVPVLLLSARAGQEASIEGLQAGADDYLVKPFVAAELLARVRANIELAKLRSHHLRWRTALVESLQEAFFVCDEVGAVIEMNKAFTDILGFGPEDLPYDPVHPWWPDAETQPEANAQIVAAFAALPDQPHGSYTVPVNHRDGHRVWITANIAHAQDPATGRSVMVGTFRDVTAEHYSVQRQTALATLNQQLAQADAVDDALHGALEQVRAQWSARRVLAAIFPGGGTTGPGSEHPDFAGDADEAQWAALVPDVREHIIELGSSGNLLTPDTSIAGSAGIALQHPRGTLVIWIELPAERPFTVEDMTLLTVLSGRLGQGLQRVHQLDQQRETALALQHSILGPDDLPAGFAVRYQPASHPLQVGGDWYDVIALDDGRIALVVGDCVGHDLSAATVMGQLRSACRALLLEKSSPAAALAGLDRFAARLPGAQSTTAFCAILNPATGALVYSSAGHPPPILVCPDGSTTLLEGGHSIALGIRPDRERPQTDAILPPQATLLLYTDGLVERRRRSLDDGIEQATNVIRDDSTLDLDPLADQIMTSLAPPGGYQDDVALLIYRHPKPLEVTIPADPLHLAPARAALRDWLTSAGIDHEQAQDVLVAAGEAVTNAIEHGYRHGQGGTITLQATSEVDLLRLTITDAGSWKPKESGYTHRGRGIQIMEALMEDVSILPDTTGTVVRLSTRIRR